MNDDDTPSIHSVRHLIDADARAHAAEAKLREAVELMRNLIDWADNQDYRPSSSLMDRAVAFLATMEKPNDP